MKRLIYEIIRLKFFNVILITILKFLKLLLPSTFIKYLAHVPVNRKIIVHIRKIPVAFISDGRDFIASRLFWKGIDGFVTETLNIFIPLLKCTSVFMDIGANTGIYSLIAATHDKNILVHSFEPNSSIFSYLERNVKENSLLNVRINKIAISDVKGDIDLYVPTFPLSLTTESSTINRYIGKTVINRTESIPSDYYVSVNNVKTVDFLKVDTERTEEKVFYGAKNTIKKFKPTIICEALWNDSEKKFERLFSNLGYIFSHIRDEGLFYMERIIGDKFQRYLNYLFVPK